MLFHFLCLLCLLHTLFANNKKNGSYSVVIDLLPRHLIGLPAPVHDSPFLLTQVLPLYRQCIPVSWYAFVCHPICPCEFPVGHLVLLLSSQNFQLCYGCWDLELPRWFLSTILGWLSTISVFALEGCTRPMIRP